MPIWKLFSDINFPNELPIKSPNPTSTSLLEISRLGAQSMENAVTKHGRTIKFNQSCISLLALIGLMLMWHRQ